MSHRTIAAAFTAFLLSAFLGSIPAAAQQIDATAATPESVNWNPAPFPGITIAVAAGNLTATGMYAIFVKFAPGAKALPHTHPDQRIVTGLSGTIRVGIGPENNEGKAAVLRPGSVVGHPPGGRDRPDRDADLGESSCQVVACSVVRSRPVPRVIGLASAASLSVVQP